MRMVLGQLDEEGDHLVVPCPRGDMQRRLGLRVPAWQKRGNVCRPAFEEPRH